MLELLTNFLSNTGFANLTWQYLVMIGMGCLLLYLGIVRGFEPLLLVPIGFGCILCNLPITGLMDEGGLLKYFLNKNMSLRLTKSLDVPEIKRAALALAVITAPWTMLLPSEWFW